MTAKTTLSPSPLANLERRALGVAPPGEISIRVDLMPFQPTYELKSRLFVKEEHPKAIDVHLPRAFFNIFERETRQKSLNRSQKASRS